MLRNRILSSIVIFCTILSGQSHNDDNNELTVFKTTDYKSYIGTIEKQNTDSISIKTYNNEVYTFSNSNILLNFPFMGRVKNGRLQKRDPNSSFYLFSPSAFAIDNGKLYCRDFCLFYPSLNFGLANIVSAQAGLFWYPGMDYNNTPFVGNLKISAFETNIFSLAGGISYVNLPVIKKEKIYSTGYAFVTGTFGNRYNHASISAGWGYIQREDEWQREDKPIVIAAGNLRILDFMSFVTENWFFPDEKFEDSLMSVALRFFGRQIAVDLGATFTANSIKEKIDPIPVINITSPLR